MRHLLIAMLASFASMAFVVDDAHAKRLGGGKSFGSKPSYSQPAQRSADQSNPSAPQQPAGAQAPASGAGAAARPGMGGLFGGLLAGTLLGALFMGGAFENIGIVDILVLGLLGFLAYRFFAARRRHAAQPAPAGGAPLPPDEPVAARPSAGTVQARMGLSGMSGSGAAVTLPPGFDAAEFLRGAEAAYRRLQAAWDSGELADLREFTTDSVFAELQDQYRARQGEHKTQVQSLRSYLQGVTEHPDRLEARVLFTATLVESDAASPLLVDPTEVEEVWHFVKPKGSARPTWYLDGIQQVESVSAT